MKIPAERRLTLGLLAVLAILLLLVAVPPAVNLWSGALRARLTAEIEDFEQAVASVEGDLQTMQAAERGYLLTQQPSFLDTYQVAEANLATSMATLRERASQLQPAPEVDFEEWEATVAEWHARITEQLRLIQQDDLAAAVAGVSSGQGQGFFDQALQVLDRLDLAGREARLTVASRVARLQTLATGLTLALGILAGIAAVYTIRIFRGSLRLAAQLAGERDRSEQATRFAEAQLHETSRANEQLTTLNRLAHAPAETVTVRSRAEHVAQTLAAAHALDAAIWLLDAQDGTLCLTAAAWLDEHSAPVEAVPAERAAVEQPVLAADSLLPAALLRAPQAEANHAGSALLPLRGRTGPLGLLLLAFRDSAVFSDTDREYLATVASQAGLALDNARLYEALHADRQRLQAIFDQSPEGVLFAERATNRVVLANQAAVALLDDQALAGCELHAPELVQRFLRPTGEPYTAADLPLARALAGDEQTRGEMIVEQRSGRRIPVLLTAVPVRDEAGGVLGAVAVFQDLSRLREVERLKSDFVAMVSHELRTPLTAIQGSTQSLLRLPEGAAGRVREFLQIIDGQSIRLQELIDNLLNLSQVEAGMLRLRREPVQIERLIRSLVRQADEHLPAVRVQADIPRPLPTIGVDPRRVEQVLLNLLDNARKASPPGGTITVAAAVEGDSMQISVADQGSGIQAEERDRVFERFYQGAAPAGAGGTGLGLAISRGLVEAHGGRIWVDPHYGPGARVVFTLPLAVAEPDAAAPLAGAIQRAHETAHILVVDDEPSMRAVLQASLANAGYTVGTAAEGLAAVEYAATERPDLIVLDLMLPGENGFGVLQRLRDFTSVPVLILTASVDEQHVVRGLELGADDYVAKPFKMDELLARVGALLRRASGAHPANEPALIHVDGLTIDLARRSVERQGQTIELTPTEFRLLAHLARHAGQVLTHEQLLQHVWGPEYGRESQYLWVHIGRLRQKIEPVPRTPRYILTERGTGYRFAGGA